MKDTMKERARLHAPSKAKALVVLVAVALVASFAVWGCSPKATSDDAKAADASTESTDGKTSAKAGDGPDELSAFSGFPTEGRFVDGVASLPDFYKNTEKNESNAKPKRRAATPTATATSCSRFPPTSWGGTTPTSTPTTAAAPRATRWRTPDEPAHVPSPDLLRVPTEQSYQNCIACHSDSYSGHKLADAIHTLHMNSTMFVDDDNGNCQSCHYIDSNTGVFERWDEVKYDLYKGITDVASDELKASVTYDQTTITPAENRIFKTVKDEPNEWLTDDSKVDTSIYENWVISIDGDCENPVEMTLPEMEQQFGTVKQVMKMDCTINGVGQATIMQSEVEGIPLKAIIDYAKPKSGANVVSPIGSDGYDYAKMGIDWLLENDAVIVTKMDGELLPNSQGYPCMIWVNKTSGGNFTKRISNLTFMTVPDDKIDAELYVGQFTDDRTGEIYSKPNSGVLNYPTGIVLSGEEAKTVHLEGFADAWDEPIKKMEFSFDHGETWTVVDTPDNNADNWTYWRMDFTPPAPGAYLLDIRTTSVTPDAPIASASTTPSSCSR